MPSTLFFKCNNLNVTDMKKPTNPSKVIIIPQTPQNNNKQEVPQCNAPADQAPAQAPVQQQAEAEAAEEEAE